MSETPTVDNILKVNPIVNFKEIHEDLKFWPLLFMTCQELSIPLQIPPSILVKNIAVLMLTDQNGVLNFQETVSEKAIREISDL